MREILSSYREARVRGATSLPHGDPWSGATGYVEKCYVVSSGKFGTTSVTHTHTHTHTQVFLSPCDWGWSWRWLRIISERLLRKIQTSTRCLNHRCRRRICHAKRRERKKNLYIPDTEFKIPNSMREGQSRWKISTSSDAESNQATSRERERAFRIVLIINSSLDQLADPAG